MKIQARQFIAFLVAACGSVMIGAAIVTASSLAHDTHATANQTMMVTEGMAIAATPVVRSSPNQPVINPLLQQSDLPEGFQPLPKFVERFLLEGIASVKTPLSTEGINIDEFYPFINFKQAEMLIAVTTQLSTQSDIATFDAGLTSPDALDQFIWGAQESLKFAGTFKVTEQQMLTNLPVGELASRFKLTGSLEQFSMMLFVDAVAFRRNSTGVLMIVGALDHPIETIQLEDFAMKLDRRLQSSAVNP